MVFLATQAVHTTGVNWDSIAVILGGFAAILTIVLSIQERRTQTTRNDITNAVNNLSDVLQAKLETKDAVRNISERLSRLEGASSSVRVEYRHDQE